MMTQPTRLRLILFLVVTIGGAAVVSPESVIVFTVIALNLVGDGLRDALDPRLNR